MSTTTEITDDSVPEGGDSSVAQITTEDQRAFDQGVDDLFGTLDRMVQAGEISREQARSFFPQHGA